MAARTGADTETHYDDIHVWHESTVRFVYSVPVSGSDNGSYRGYRHGTARLQLSAHMDVQRGMLHGRRLYYARAVRDGRSRRCSRWRDQNDSLVSRHYVRIDGRRAVHCTSDGRGHGEQMGRRCAWKTRHLRRSHWSKWVPVSGQQR